MKLEENMYVRTKDGEIHKCLLIYIDDNNPTLNRFMNEWGYMIMFDEIKGEPSHNIIDLIYTIFCSITYCIRNNNFYLYPQIVSIAHTFIFKAKIYCFCSIHRNTSVARLCSYS